MAPRSYRIDTSFFRGIAVTRCRDTHYHSDCAAALSGALDTARQGAETGIVVLDLAPVVLFSSSALRAMRASHVAADKAGGRIVAAGGGDMVRSVLKFAPFIRHFPDVKQALAALSPEAAAAYEQAEGQK